MRSQEELKPTDHGAVHTFTGAGGGTEASDSHACARGRTSAVRISHRGRESAFWRVLKDAERLECILFSVRLRSDAVTVHSSRNAIYHSYLQTRNL